MAAIVPASPKGYWFIGETTDWLCVNKNNFDCIDDNEVWLLSMLLHIKLFWGIVCFYGGICLQLQEGYFYSC